MKNLQQIDEGPGEKVKQNWSFNDTFLTNILNKIEHKLGIL